MHKQIYKKILDLQKHTMFASILKSKNTDKSLNISVKQNKDYLEHDKFLDYVSVKNFTKYRPELNKKIYK